MKLIFSFSIPVFCIAQTLLSQADLLSEQYNGEIAKAPPPSSMAQTERCLDVASIWFSLDLQHLAVPQGQTALEVLSSEELLKMLKEIGVEGIYLEHLREGFSVAPKWGLDWPCFSMETKKRNLSLVGDGLQNTTGWSADFELALQNVGEYPSLYHLIEIASVDWDLLPRMSPGELIGNVPWLSIQELHKRGYVPECYSPYTKESSWNATAPICGTDGKMRRWIYLKQGCGEPALAWLSPSFGASRIAAADSLCAVYQLGEKILSIDDRLPLFAKKTNALWLRKLGAFSAEKISGGIKKLKRAVGDVTFDILTRAPLLHALIAEDAEALRLIYRLFLCEKIPINRLVHTLQPFDQFACDWVELACNPRKQYRYWQEQVTGEILRQRLLKEDLLRLGGKTLHLSTWAGFCAAALGYKNAKRHREEIAHAHLLLAFTYAMQPGVFSFSASDLLGALPEQAKQLDLMEPNSTTLYASLPSQLKNPRSFASQLRDLLAIRRQWNFAKGELIDVPNVRHQNVLLLVHRQKENLFVTAVNFGKSVAQEAVDIAAIRNSNAIELLSGLMEKKTFESSQFSFSLSPLSGKVFMFQPKYYH